MAKCSGCSSSSCNCLITEGNRIDITGTGASGDAFIINSSYTPDRMHRWTDTAPPVSVVDDVSADISSLFDADVGTPTSSPGSSLSWDGSVVHVLIDGLYSAVCILRLETRPDLGGWFGVQISTSNENPGITFRSQDQQDLGSSLGIWTTSVMPPVWLTTGDTIAFYALNKLGATVDFSGADFVVARVA